MFDQYESEPSGYDTAQICLNGHLINDSFGRSPNHNQNFCSECGAKTITTCPKCNANIRGDYYVPGILVAGGKYDVPKHCHQCGEMYPWVLKKIEAAKEFTDELDKLSKKEKEELKKSIEDLIKNNSSSDLAALRFKKLVAKAGQTAYDGLKSILVSIVTEVIKKKIGL